MFKMHLIIFEDTTAQYLTLKLTPAPSNDKLGMIRAGKKVGVILAV